jgi:hypothetical protein
LVEAISSAELTCDPVGNATASQLYGELAREEQRRSGNAIDH